VRSVCVSLFLLIPFAMETLSSPPQPRVLDNMCVDAPAQAYAEIRRCIGPHDIVLTTGFPFLAWLTGRPALGLPEYPDLIYTLIGDYQLPIRGIFLYKMKSFVPDVLAANWNAGFAGYSRISQHLYPIPGFTLHSTYVLPAPQQGTAQLYVRDDFDKVSPLFSTKRIEFGDSRDSIHLIYGWGPISVQDGRRVSL